MAEKPPLYTVTDRRKFTTDGALREGRPADPEPAAPVSPVAETPGPGLHLVDKGGADKGGPAEGAPLPEIDPDTDQHSGFLDEHDQSAGDLEQTGLDTDDPAGPEGLVSDDLGGDDLGDADLGPAPTAAETAQQHEAYRRSSDLIDTMVQQANPGTPPSVEMDFQQLVQSIYLSAIVALGAGGEPGQKPRIDILGARQSIDMLAVLGDKTEGNLTEAEQRLLQSALFNLRMMFLEITNALATSAQRPPSGGKPGPVR